MRGTIYTVTLDSNVIERYLLKVTFFPIHLRLLLGFFLPPYAAAWFGPTVEWHQTGTYEGHSTDFSYNSYQHLFQDNLELRHRQKVLVAEKENLVGLNSNLNAAAQMSSKSLKSLD